MIDCFRAISSVGAKTGRQAPVGSPPASNEGSRPISAGDERLLCGIGKCSRMIEYHDM